MRFFISFNHVEGEWEKLSDAEREGHTKTLREFAQGLKHEKGTDLVFFAPSQQAQTVHIDSGTPLRLLDGPALPGLEANGGYYIIEADSLDEAPSGRNVADSSSAPTRFARSSSSSPSHPGTARIPFDTCGREVRGDAKRR